MSTLKFTLPLSLSIHPGRRHSRKGPRPSAPRDEQDGTSSEGQASGTSEAASFRGSPEKASHLLRHLRKSIRRGFVSDIDMALSFVLEASRDERDAPTATVIDPSLTPLDAAPAPLVKSQICPACDAANEASAKFCNQCGGAFPPPTES